MDEMVVDDLVEDDIDLSSDAVGDEELDQVLEEDDVADITEDILGLDEEEDDEDPEFSLDDFAPDALDDDDDEEEDAKK